MKSVNGRRFVAAILVIGAGAWLAGCNLPPVANPRLPPQGSSRQLAEGYVAGCDAGTQDANPTGWYGAGLTDHKRYASDPEYKKGWDEGRAACYEDELKAPVMNISGGGADNT